jgi:hypothetical protein
VSTPTGTARSTAPSNRLPIAGPAEARRHTWMLMRRHRRWLVLAVSMHGLAALAGLVGPALLGRLVDGVGNGMTAATVDRIAVLLACALVVQVVLTWFAYRSSGVLAETVFAQLREEFLDRVTRLPLSTVERAGTGDLVTRTTTDIEELSYSVRFAVPKVLLASVACTLTIAALGSPPRWSRWRRWSGQPPLMMGTRWYLARARTAPREVSSHTTYNGPSPRPSRGRGRSRGCGWPRTVAAGWTTTCARCTPRSGTRCGCARSGTRSPSPPTRCRWWPRWAGAAGWCWPGTRRRGR